MMGLHQSRAFLWLNLFGLLALASSNRPLPQPESPHRVHDTSSSSNNTFLATAVLNSPSPPYHAIIECWALTTPFSIYPTVGKALTLGDTSNATYVVLPPRSAEGWHRPPANMEVIHRRTGLQVSIVARMGQCTFLWASANSATSTGISSFCQAPPMFMHLHRSWSSEILDTTEMNTKLNICTLNPVKINSSSPWTATCVLPDTSLTTPEIRKQ